MRPFNMLSNIALNAVVFALLALVITAAPTEVHKRDASIVNTCANGNQVALTFDGEPCLSIAETSLIVVALSQTVRTFTNKTLPVA